MLRFICFHWTAGGSYPNTVDLNHYHFLVDIDRNVTLGRHRPESNVPPLRPGRYAAHCGGGNSWRIGLALCGGPRGHRHGEIIRPQFERACELAAQLCLQYGIAITPETVHTHYEFGLANPRSSSRGKPDISSLPWEPTLKPGEVGDYIRGKVRWYHQRLSSPDGGIVTSPVPDDGRDDNQRGWATYKVTRPAKR